MDDSAAVARCSRVTAPCEAAIASRLPEAVGGLGRAPGVGAQEDLGTQAVQGGVEIVGRVARLLPQERLIEEGEGPVVASGEVLDLGLQGGEQWLGSGPARPVGGKSGRHPCRAGIGLAGAGQDPTVEGGRRGSEEREPMVVGDGDRPCRMVTDRAGVLERKPGQALNIAAVAMLNGCCWMCVIFGSLEQV